MPSPPVPRRSFCTPLQAAGGHQSETEPKSQNIPTSSVPLSVELKGELLSRETNSVEVLIGTALRPLPTFALAARGNKREGKLTHPTNNVIGTLKEQRARGMPDEPPYFHMSFWGPAIRAGRGWRSRPGGDWPVTSCLIGAETLDRHGSTVICLDHHHHQAFVSGGFARSETPDESKRLRWRTRWGYVSSTSQRGDCARERHKQLSFAAALATAHHHSNNRKEKAKVVECEGRDGAGTERRPTGTVPSTSWSLPAPLPEVAESQGSTVARCPVDGGPTLAMPVLAGRAAEMVDFFALSFLTAQALEGKRKEEQEEKEKEKKLDELTKAWRELTSMKITESASSAGPSIFYAQVDPRSILLPALFARKSGLSSSPAFLAVSGSPVEYRVMER